MISLQNMKGTKDHCVVFVRPGNSWIEEEFSRKLVFLNGGAEHLFRRYLVSPKH